MHPTQSSRNDAPEADRAWGLPAALVGVIAGAALQLQQPDLWGWRVYAGLLALELLASALLLGRAGRWLRRWQPTVRQGVLALTAATLVFALTGWRACGMAADSLDPALEGRDIQVTGVVAAMPQAHEAGVRLRLAVESARLNGEAVRLPALIDLAWYSGAFRDEAPSGAGARAAPPWRAGERWQMTVRLKAPRGLVNPHGFDYELWLWEQGVRATGYVRASPRDALPVRLAATWRYPVEQARQRVRDAIQRQLAPSATYKDSEEDAGRAAGVVAALVTGDQRSIDRADWDVFRATGVAHLMSISGLHITLFAWLAAAVVRFLWRRSERLCLAVSAPSAALVGGVALAGAYALFSGWGVPAQRTVCMLATLALLRLSGLRWPWPHVWLLACAAVVAWDPWALLQPGFWLSFMAVAVLFATNPIAAPARSTGPKGHFYALLREQWVVTLALTPLSLLLFGQVSVVGFVANLVAIPWVTLVVTPLALAGVFWAPLWTLSAWSLGPLGAFLQWLAAWPWASVHMPAPALWAGVLAVAGGALLATRLPWQVRATALPLLLPLLWWQAPRPVAGQFELLAPDIGQGSAVLVRTAQHTLLFDAGPRYSRESDAGHRVLVPLLRAMGERLDVLMLSHRDTDHTGGAAAVLTAQPQAALTGSIESDDALQALRSSTPCEAGQQWVWDGVRFEVLHPEAGERLQGREQRGGRRARQPTNPTSCVLRVEAAVPQSSAATDRAASVALLTGDIEHTQEKALLARAAPVQADVLLVPHHGSKTSSSAIFLDAVQPRMAWVQAGYRNRFGHPAPEVLQRYQERGIAVVDSMRCGAATWSSAQPQQVRCEREAGRRYWHHRLQ